jgi:DNA-binding NarL/FixJ family response regulator
VKRSYTHTTVSTYDRLWYKSLFQVWLTIAAKAFSQFKAPCNGITPNSLSKREIEVLKLVGQGKNNLEISQELYLGEGTVKNHVTQILSKLAMRDRIGAALWAQQHLS